MWKLFLSSNILLLPGSGEGRGIVYPRTELSHTCSRPISRAVRKALDTNILRPAGAAGVEAWPRGCPLDPARDLWGGHEKQKNRKRGQSGHWTCGYCGKVFKSEHYLDLHMERKHMSETPVSGVCLADYCEAFESCHGDKSKRKRHAAKEDDCDNTTMEKHRHDCEQAMSRCFALDKDASRKLHAQFSREYCRTLDCRIRAHRRSEVQSEYMPVIIWLIFIVLICIVVFAVVVCCVDYSDDIFQSLQDSGIASSATIRRLIRTREQVRENVGMDRMHRI